MSCPSRGWLSFVLHDRLSCPALRKTPPPQGCPHRKSVAHPPRCRNWFTRYSLGLLSDSGLSPIDPAGNTNRPKSSALCSSPNRSWAPPDHRPAEANLRYQQDRRPRIFWLPLPPLARSSSQPRVSKPYTRFPACSLDAEASRWRYSLPGRIVADVPRDCRDALLISVGAPACADQ